MKNIIRSTYANLYLNAADGLGLQYRIEDKEASIAYIFNKHKEIRLESHRLRLNTDKSRARSLDKETTSTLLQKAHIPVPAFEVFTDRAKAIQYASEKVKNHIGIVIKPTNGSNAIGITIHPTTQIQVRKAVKDAFRKVEKIIIEDHIFGNHYRITVLDGEIIAVTQRIPAYVITDGIRTIKELILQKNLVRAKKKLPLITLRDKDFNYLRSARIKLTDIYPHGGNMRLQHGCDYDVGGERLRIAIDSIPQVNQRLFIKAVGVLKLRFGGIDYISPDITTPYTQIHTAINEINGAPHQDVHHLDRYPYDNYAAIRIIEKIFQD